MLEGRYVSFLADRIGDVVDRLPDGNEREELELFVGELKDVIPVVFEGAKDTPKPRQHARRGTNRRSQSEASIQASLGE